jgi:hypothetical protein
MGAGAGGCATGAQTQNSRAVPPTRRGETMKYENSDEQRRGEQNSAEMQKSEGGNSKLKTSEVEDMALWRKRNPDLLLFS